MSNILQIGYTVEGPTDQRFLANIIRKTFETLIFDCNSDIEVYEPEYLPKDGNTFVSQIENLVTEYSYFHVICIHCDSDGPSIENVLRNKINPAVEAVGRLDAACKNLISIIPIQMTEAWMMADLSLLKEKIGTSLSNTELNLPTRINQIERLPDPKSTISNALTIAQDCVPRRRRKIQISSLYSPISQEISIDSLSQLSSYKRFQDEVRDSLRRLNYLT